MGRTSMHQEAHPVVEVDFLLVWDEIYREVEAALCIPAATSGC